MTFSHKNLRIMFFFLVNGNFVKILYKKKSLCYNYLKMPKNNQRRLVRQLLLEKKERVEELMPPTPTNYPKKGKYPPPP